MRVIKLSERINYQCSVEYCVLCIENINLVSIQTLDQPYSDCHEVSCSDNLDSILSFHYLCSAQLSSVISILLVARTTLCTNLVTFSLIIIIHPVNHLYFENFYSQFNFLLLKKRIEQRPNNPNDPPKQFLD